MSYFSPSNLTRNRIKHKFFENFTVGRGCPVFTINKFKFSLSLKLVMFCQIFTDIVILIKMSTGFQMYNLIKIKPLQFVV